MSVEFNPFINIKSISSRIGNIHTKRIFNFNYKSMKNNSISHLKLAWKFGESILLYIRNEEVNHPNPKILMYSLRFKAFHIPELEKLLKIVPFEKVDLEDEAIQNYYRIQIIKNFPTAMIYDSLAAFEKK